MNKSFSLRSFMCAAAIHFSICLLLLPKGCAAIKCGIKGVSKSCVGSKDIRYDSSKSYDLEEYSTFWNAYVGFYVIDEYMYGPDGTPLTESSLDVYPLLPSVGTFDLSPRKIFRNVTVDGSRLYIHNYAMVKHTETETGKPGLVIAEDDYFIATHEKDGSAVILGHGNTFDDFHILGSDEEEEGDEDEEESLALMTPNDETTSAFYLEVSHEKVNKYSLLCFDDRCNTFSAFKETYDTSAPKPVLESYSRTSFGTKFDTADAWIVSMQATMTDFAIPATPTAPFDQSYFAAPEDPRSATCATGVCPSELDWESKDPNYTVSPYIEPPGAHEGAFLAGVIIAAIVVLVVAFYLFYKNRMAAREKRLKEIFASSIATFCGVSKTSNLSSTELSAMFQQVDTDNSGLIDKSEFRGLISSSGINKFSDADFELLYKSVDTDGSGEVDFLEFCSFYASIPDSEEEAFAEA